MGVNGHKKPESAGIGKNSLLLKSNMGSFFLLLPNHQFDLEDQPDNTITKIIVGTCTK